jgi:branched-chain amino acid transport system ATP-binding protein
MKKSGGRDTDVIGTLPQRSERAMLEMRGVYAGYSKTLVLRGVDLVVNSGSVVALLGSNGAGKTTLLRTLAGIVNPTSGSVFVGADDVTREPPYRRTQRGVCLIPEGRGIFPGLTVRENLRIQVPPRSTERHAIELAISSFPVLGKRLSQLAGTMSGGERQMLALARAWSSQAKLILLDEVSTGLAPMVVDEIYSALNGLAARSETALLIVEQYVNRVLGIADDVYLLEKGEVSFHGAPNKLGQSELLSRYLGAGNPPPPVS